MRGDNLEKKWILPSYLPNPAAKAKLFCFPFAGGSASFYRNWSLSLPDIDVVPIQLPGREGRLFEQPFLDIQDLIHSLAPQIVPLLDGPFSLMGYSMGGIIAYELAHYLQSIHGLSPEHLYVGACRSPQSDDWLALPRAYSDDEIITRLRDLGGTPQEILAQSDYLAIVLPTIRADFLLCASYRPRTNASKLSSSIHVFGGTQDRTASPNEMARWAAETTGPFEHKQYEGGHFFIHDHLTDIQASIQTSMCTTICI